MLNKECCLFLKRIPAYGFFQRKGRLRLNGKQQVLEACSKTELASGSGSLYRVFQSLDVCYIWDTSFRVNRQWTVGPAV